MHKETSQLETQFMHAYIVNESTLPLDIVS